ncbi:UNC45A [Cordylochernes scorpioides]|uniref:Protein unc-45 homolog B n=1 Tax=Cordylochernes scorpioides TaxID=51811 RepID=A0ABY6K6C0_9ARAC|nr:UNC45A [Cordylochernes scorpioides]
MLWFDYNSVLLSSTKMVVNGDCVTDTAKSLKDEGNKHFAAGDYDKALECYTKALKIAPDKHPDRVIFYKNRAAVHLKKNNYEKAVEDATAALELDPADVKALFRRCQALQNLGRHADAFKDARAVQHLDPNNSAILPVLRDLNAKIQEKSPPPDDERVFLDAPYLQAQEVLVDTGLGRCQDGQGVVLQVMPEDPSLQVRGLLGDSEGLQDDRPDPPTGPVAAKEHSSTINKVKQMLSILQDPSMAQDKRETAANNLIVLSRENAGTQLIAAEDGDSQLIDLLRTSTSATLVLSGIRILAQMCQSSLDLTLRILEKVGVPFFIDLLNRTGSAEYISAVQYWVQMIINTLSGMDLKQGTKPDKQLMKRNEYVIDTLMETLVSTVDRRQLDPEARDAILELLMKNVDIDALNWGMKLVEKGGLSHILEVSSELPNPICESAMKITPNTRTHVSVALERIYWCMDHDKARDLYRDKVSEFMKDRLSGPDVESKVRAVSSITTLLMGPLDVGNFCLGQQGILEMMLVMANTDDELQQRVAAEAIIAAAQKKDKCSSIANLGVNILKKLYQSKNENIRVRALVGLCKVASMGGTDASIRPFADGSNKKLATSCRKFLISPSKDVDLRKWAAEGLSYLTLDGDCKEELIQDRAALRALYELAQKGDLSVVYGVVLTLVNLTNSYDTQEVLPELIELAKFAKQHIPEEHPMDHPDFVAKRIQILAETGVTNALVALSKTESHSCKEMIARVFAAICERQEHRGMVVQQGGAKALLKLALEGNKNGKLVATQALCRIGISINPEVAFPGQRCCEVVRPMMSLLHPECTGLQNFEALMALTNLAQVSPTVRNHILRNSGFTHIESYMYEEHPFLKRAATECILNLLSSPEVVKMFEGENDRVKYLLLLLEEEDLETVLAAAGALATLTFQNQAICEKLLKVSCWEEEMTKLVANENKELVHRGICILYNLVDCCRETAEPVVATQLLELLMAITRPEVDDIPANVKELAQKVLDRARKWGIIQHVSEAQQEEAEE